MADSLNISKDTINQGASDSIKSSYDTYDPLVKKDTVSGLSTNYQNDITDPNKELTDKGLNYTYKPVVNDKSQDELGYGTLLPQKTDYDVANATTTDVTAPTEQTSAGYTATQTKGAKGTVDPNSLVENQYEKLLNQNLDENGVPKWASPAVAASNQRANALGLGASTMATNASTTAILNAALPIAEADAKVYKDLNSQNLSNSQDAMLSDASWDNAAKQFNAKEDQQNFQFYDSLSADIANKNADRDVGVSKYNAGQYNYNKQFLDKLNSDRDEFNVKNELLVDQSNVAWRRTVNTTNTAGENAANQANTKDAYNLSTTGQNNLWQQARDEASWSLTSDENSKSRELSLTNSALNRSTSLDILDSTLSANTFSSVGSFATNVVSSGTKLLTSDSGSSSSSSSSGSDFGGGGDLPAVTE